MTSDIDLSQPGTAVATAAPDGATEFAANEVAKLQAALSQLASEDNVGTMVRVAGVVVGCLRSGGKVLFCGNGGSAADAQHLAAELVGRQNYDRGRPPGSH